MTQRQKTRPVKKDNSNLSSEEEHKRKQEVLTPGTPSITKSIADAVVIKNENFFLVTNPNGNVPLGGDHGFGFYYNDTRFLSGYEMTLGEKHFNPLVSNASKGFEAVFELTNPEISIEGGNHLPGGDHLPINEIGVKWERVIDAETQTLNELITIRNYWRKQIHCPLTLTFEADFKDVFAIRGLLNERPGKIQKPKFEDGALSFVYEGADGLTRSLIIHFSKKPELIDEASVRFIFELRPEESKEILVSLTVLESEEIEVDKKVDHKQPNLDNVRQYLKQESDEWLQDQTSIQTDSLLLNRVLERSMRDLRTLRSNLEDEEYFAAGVPWFVTLFGRDSIITALQTLAYNPKIAEQTLRLLADYQGTEENSFREEQPGRILHELRVGELARLGEIPHTPYYGSIDATPLFLILLAEHAAWTGSLELFNDLRENIERAINWMDQYGGLKDGGYLSYKSKTDKGIVNQGWKDSGNGIVTADGRLAKPPVALVEVQGYAYMAKRMMADLFERADENDRARKLRHEADLLYKCFNRDFWLENLGYYALALQNGGKPAAVISSNPGQALWTRIVEPDRAKQTVNRLMARDMFSGWGIRTLSEKERSYNPIGYHLGTVWPHDNAIIASGFRKYGFDDEARQIFTSIVEAAMQFDYYRLPEVFAGFQRSEYNVPVHYPVACHPQAWSAGTVPFLVEIMLGLEPDAFSNRLLVTRPILPDFIDRLEVRELKVGNARVDLKFERTSDDNVAVKVLRVDGKLDIVLTQGSE